MRGVEGVSGSGPVGVERGGAACGETPWLHMGLLAPESLCPSQLLPRKFQPAGFRNSGKWKKLSPQRRGMVGCNTGLIPVGGIILWNGSWDLVPVTAWGSLPVPSP